jgi:aspartate carbamoyltransferase catalytic subunit
MKEEDQIILRLQEIRGEYEFPCADLHSVEQIQKQDCEMIFSLARLFRKEKTIKLSLLKGVSIALAFFESSTRTKSSFEWAGKQLGADTINAGSGTAEKKGESLIDLAQTLDAMNPKAIVIRTSYSGLPEQISRHTSAAIINAGDGWHEHPTQGLLDALTMIERLGSLSGKKVTIIGDITHSRVFGSLIRILNMYGASVTVSAPETLIPEKMEEVFGVVYEPDVEKALPDSDVVYALRVQNERGATGDISTIREYSKAYGISPQRFALAKKDSLLMHPGPIQRDVDVHSCLAAIDQSQILQQIENGLALRKAVLWLLCTQKTPKEFIRF